MHIPFQTLTRLTTLATLTTLLLLTPLSSAHGRITNITTSTGAVYSGWDPETASSPSPIAAWSSSNLGNTYITPSSFNTSNITCHFLSTPGSLHIPVSSGSLLTFQWNEWPTSHKGPVITYIASCNSSCVGVDKDLLRWVKIDELGWLNATGQEMKLGGTWASDVLVANGFSWVVKLPKVLRGGAYVIRHEVLALHVAEVLDGAQAYPQCVNVMVEGGGLDGKGEEVKIEDGVDARSFYGVRDKGILVDIHGRLEGYDIPGPRLWKWAEPVRQVGLRKVVV